jgi:hypothetical protein|tara:strand:- start:1878 stop:2600 length:723 start_codon:yes stop_codon:yes gene_type:complete
MKNSLLNKPAFRYIFEIIVIVFSVTLSFYIQKVLLDKEKLELKNIGLMGVIDDLNRDQQIFDGSINYYHSRIRDIDSILDLNFECNTNKLNSVRSYFGFLPQNRNFNSMVSTGAIEYIENNDLFDLINTYYSTQYSLLADMANQDEKNYNIISEYINKAITVRTSDLREQSFGVSFLLKKDSVYDFIYKTKDFKKIRSDDWFISILSSQKWTIRAYLNSTKKALAVNKELKKLIDSELIE